MFVLFIFPQNVHCHCFNVNLFARVFAVAVRVRLGKYYRDRLSFVSLILSVTGFWVLKMLLHEIYPSVFFLVVDKGTLFCDGTTDPSDIE